jgi:hypothetical protein
MFTEPVHRFLRFNPHAVIVDSSVTVDVCYLSVQNENTLDDTKSHWAKVGVDCHICELWFQGFVSWSISTLVSAVKHHHQSVVKREI